jgi:2-polyprenyl-6-methoxyphenol hydroxylase-like FAD-dependent oxidoreductase
MRVIIVGAGIGGLSAAIGLRAQGHEVVVLERAPRLDPLGAGITLFGNAMTALAGLGVADAVRAAGAPARHSAIRTSDGRELTTVPADLLEGAIALHRGDLQAALVQAAGEIRLGADIASVDQTEDEVIARAADGSEHRGDLLVGADGLRSFVRGSVAPAKLQYGGYTAWRGISPMTVEQGHFTESWGVGERFGLVDIGSRTYWFATANLPESESDDPTGRKADLMRRFSAWHAPIPSILDATPGKTILRNDVYFLDPLPRWSQGRIVLLGDAAHATTPGIGQGAAQAIEDAVVLADELSQTDQLGDALTGYESIRRPRAELTLKLSRQADRAAQLTNPIGRRVRNLLVRYAPASIQRRQMSPLIHPESEDRGSAG